MIDENKEKFPIYIEIKETEFSNELQKQIEKNNITLPLLYNPDNEKFVGLSHLYSIYYDSYKCILCGIYHPGIMILGQLIEVTLKEIILVHDGINHEKPLEYLIKYAENKDGKYRKGNQSPLLPKYIIQQLKKIKDEIRNPYMHLNYKNIFKGKKIPGIKFNTGTTSEELLKNITALMERIKKSELEFTEVDPGIDAGLADLHKRQNEQNKAITLAYKIYPFFELLIDEYLTEADYDMHRQKYGSKYDTVPLTEV